MPRTRKKKYKLPLSRLIRKYIRYWRREFRLPNWPVFYQGIKDLKGGEDTDCLATIQINCDSNEINLKYDTSLRPDEALIKRLMAHEALHWVLDETDNFIRNRLDKKDFAYYREVQEKAIEDISVALSGTEQSMPSHLWWFGKTACDDECKKTR